MASDRPLPPPPSLKTSFGSLSPVKKTSCLEKTFKVLCLGCRRVAPFVRTSPPRFALLALSSSVVSCFPYKIGQLHPVLLAHPPLFLALLRQDVLPPFFSINYLFPWCPVIVKILEIRPLPRHCRAFSSLQSASSLSEAIDPPVLIRIFFSSREQPPSLLVFFSPALSRPFFFLPLCKRLTRPIVRVFCFRTRPCGSFCSWVFLPPAGACGRPPLPLGSVVSRAKHYRSASAVPSFP